MVPRVWLVLACGFGLTGSALAVVESTPKNQKKKTSATTKAGPKKKGSAPTTASRKGTGSPSKKGVGGASKKGAVTASKKGASVSSSSGKKAVRPGAGQRPVRTVRRTPVQRQPAPERYKEIQQALASRGYFQNTPDGAWGPSSVDALKRFQQDQNLDPTGKLNSLSLIALGLGPKREAPLAAPPSPQAPK